MRSLRSRHVSLCLTSIALCLSCGEGSDSSNVQTSVVDGTPTTNGTIPNTGDSNNPTPTVAPNPSNGPSPTPSSSQPQPDGPTAVGPDSTGVVTNPTPPGPTGPTGPTGPVGPTSTDGPSPDPTQVGPDNTQNPDPGPTPTGNDGAGGMPPDVEEPDVDEGGKMNASKGSRTDVAQDYLRLGDIRILNNNWGSEDIGCGEANSTMNVFVNDDGRFGWEFNRGNCAQAGDSSHPDFPQLEFGIHPFGIGSADATSPNFSSTTLMPIQIGDVTSASVTLQDLTIDLQQGGSWNITMEFWLSERNPLEPNPGVYAEIMTFWGWQGGRWPPSPGTEGASDGGSGTGDNVSAGDKSYTLWVQRNQWAGGWRYFQFRANDGPQNGFSGKVDVKAFLDYLKSRPDDGNPYPDTLWLTRMEVGSEIDNNTQGRVSMSGVTFEVNGESRSQVFGP